MLVSGGLLSGFGYLMGIIPLLALGLGALFLAVMILFLPESPSFRANRLATMSSMPSMMNLEALIEDLDVSARGIYIPVTGFGLIPKVFVPMVESEPVLLPSLQLAASNRIFVTVGSNPRDRGMLLLPPGGDILSAIENSMQIDLAAVQGDDLEHRLALALDVLGLSRKTTVRSEKDSVNVEMDLTAFLEVEEKLRATAPRLVQQIGTPLTSAIASAISKASGKYVRLNSSTLNDSKMSVHLKLLGGKPN